jgi:hypothetical protein
MPPCRSQRKRAARRRLKHEEVEIAQISGTAGIPSVAPDVRIGDDYPASRPIPNSSAA